MEPNPGIGERRTKPNDKEEEQVLSPELQTLEDRLSKRLNFMLVDALKVALEELS